MARIRTVKPEVAQHEILFEIEQDLNCAVRFAWVMLPSQCCREGRFKWRPRPLKVNLLPYDSCDFSRVLDAWLTRGMIVKYRVGHDWYGCIPTWKRHQSINNREADSQLPSVDDADEVIDYSDQEHVDASATRDARDSDAQGTRLEGKGREGKGKEVKHLSGKPDDAESRFDGFWAAWPNTPRRTAKAKCREKWKARKLDRIADQILLHVEALKKTEAWQTGFEPAPLTYINQSRWEDGLPGADGAPAAAWHETKTGITEKGKQIGMAPESFPDFQTFRQAVLKHEGMAA